MAELKSALNEVAGNAGTALQRDAAIALRRMERAAKVVLKVGPDTNELQQLLARLLAPEAGPPVTREPLAARSSPLIIP